MENHNAIHGKKTEMATFNSYVSQYQGVYPFITQYCPMIIHYHPTKPHQNTTCSTAMSVTTSKSLHSLPVNYGKLSVSMAFNGKTH